MAGKLPVRRRRQEPEDNGCNWTGALTGGLAGAGSGYLMSQLMGAEQEDPLEEGGLGDWGAAQCTGQVSSASISALDSRSIHKRLTLGAA